MGFTTLATVSLTACWVFKCTKLPKIVLMLETELQSSKQNHETICKQLWLFFIVLRGI